VKKPIASKSDAPSTLPLVRCAIYTRKSSEEGLQQEFNSLDAQRESAEAFIRSQQHEGWHLLPERYDDGGFTGGNMDRPALQRLLADIEAGRVDCVLVYKVDRLSRSLLDFARMMQTFERYKIAFVSITQDFNTSTSMGRLMLNVLLSFAQFEREIISERTRDKIAATRRKGKWAGGMPLLGYDVGPKGSKLAVNLEEAERVRAIFELYLEHGSLLPVVKELESRGWANKRWLTRKGQQRGGARLTRTNLHRLLTNVAYIGKVRHKDAVYPGEHWPIVDPAVFQKVQEGLHRNGRTGGAHVRNKHGALLKGLLRCTPCGCAMTPSFTVKGSKHYRYYTCSGAQKRGWDTCPSKSVPAGQIEDLLVERIRCVGSDPALVREVLAQARVQGEARTAELEAERRGLERDAAAWATEIRKLTTQIRPGSDNGPSIARLADLQERIGKVEGRAQQVREQIRSVHRGLVDEEEAQTALSAFDPVWGSLTPAERTRVVALLVEQVDFDGAKGKVSIAFRASGIKTLADELAAEHKRGMRA
jgi:site-specific DNA recombinase